ncbi:MAG: hypothetical protein KJ606_09900 [Chloroflexi bacterium]|nr:hypothetical protein [Chloroflexota bacterium]
MKLDKALSRDRKYQKRANSIQPKPSKGEKAMSHKTKAAVAPAAQSCASRCANHYGDNSTHILKMQAGGAKW